MTVGALNTQIRRYQAADPPPRTGTTPACPACLLGECERCTHWADTRRVIAGQPNRTPACTHNCIGKAT